MKTCSMHMYPRNFYTRSIPMYAGMPDDRCWVVGYLFAGHRSQPLNRPLLFQVCRVMIQSS